MATNAADSAKSKTLSHIYAGFISGLTSSALLQPLDLLKTRVQQNKSSTLRSSLGELQSIADAWKGTLPSMLRTSVGGALYFASLNSIRSHLASWQTASSGSNASSSLPKLSVWLNLSAGAFARASVGFVTMPITVVKVRIESSKYSAYNLLGTVKSIYQEASIAGFFKGYGVTAARDAPYAGLYVLFYEKNKEILNNFMLLGNDRSVSSAAINSGSAVIAATLATTSTGPFDTIKTRMQLDPIKYSSFTKTFRSIYNEGGISSFFDGLSLRLARKALSSGIGWMIYEELLNRSSKARIARGLEKPL